MPPGSVQICKVAFARFTYPGWHEHKQKQLERTLTDAVAVEDASPGPLAPSWCRPKSCCVLLACP